MFRHLDDFLIDRVFQKIANTISDRTGRSCYWLAAQACAAYLSFAVIGAVEIARAKSDALWVIQVVWIIAVAGAGVAGLAMNRGRDKSVGTAILPIRPAEFGLRVFGICLAACMIPLIVWPNQPFDMLVGIFNFFQLIALYFAACYPRPPKPKPAQAPVWRGATVDTRA